MSATRAAGPRGQKITAAYGLRSFRKLVLLYYSEILPSRLLDYHRPFLLRTYFPLVVSTQPPVQSRDCMAFPVLVRNVRGLRRLAFVDLTVLTTQLNKSTIPCIFVLIFYR